MKGKCMKKLEIKERPSKMVSIRIPLDTLEQLKEIAASRKLGYQSLLKLYIGEGLRKDKADMKKHLILANQFFNKNANSPNTYTLLVF